MRRALACIGVLLTGVLAPRAVLAQSMADRMAGMGASSPAVNTGPWTAPYANGAQCFPARALSGVVASDARDVILRIGRADFYRLRLTRACPALLEPGAHVDIQSGPTIICGPADLELRVAAGDGPVSRCAADTLSRMSMAEVKAASAPR